MKIGIIGMGLIGGSIGKATVKYTSHEAYGFDLNERVMQKMQRVGAACGSLEGRLGDIDMLIVALREADAVKTIENSVALLKDGAIVIDCCGNKKSVVECMERMKNSRPVLRFVGVHPMAGREYNGLDASTADLFKGAYILTVPIAGDYAAVDAVKELFMQFGAKDIEICTAKRHDKMIAYTSQLAHILSSSYVKDPCSREHTGYSAGSFEDLTRVARLDADMWTELFMNNRDNLIPHIDLLIKELEKYRDTLECGDSAGLHELLEEGTAAKERADRGERSGNEDALS